MGQYQQWLHYRTVDQQLHSQQEQLAKELADLHGQAALCKDSASVTENVIIQALARLFREFSQAPVSSAQPTERGKSPLALVDTGPINQQSLRTNQLVQRWMERWGRLPAPGEVRADVPTIFALLRPQDVEQFSQSYHYWQLQQRITQLQAQISTVQQQAHENSERMEQLSPGAIALATLARLQASGVNDIDLLDSMLERGEAWLDHTMQLLEQCERLKVFDGDYTHWCELALEGAYDWISSMLEANSLPTSQEASPPASSSEQITEEMVLQKLMSDDGSEPLPVSTDETPALIAIPAEETTAPQGVEVPTAEVVPRSEDAPPREEIALTSIEEPALAEEPGQQKMSTESAAAQVSSSRDRVPHQEQEVNIPETPRPATLATEAEESEREEELVSIPQATVSASSDEDIHAVEEIMYFTEEACWQWEEPTSSQIHLPTLPENRKEPNMQDVQPTKQGFFQRLFKKKGTEQP